MPHLSYDGLSPSLLFAMKPFQLLAASLLLAALPSLVWAQEASGLQLSGFASLVGGRVVSGSTPVPDSYVTGCKYPCYPPVSE